MEIFHFNLFELDKLPEDVAQLIRESGSPVDLLNRLPAFIKDKVRGQTIHGMVEKGAIIHGDVFVGEGSTVHSGVVIEGPVYIGKNVSVRPHANIRHGAYLSDDCVIGHSADIKNTLALPGCKIQDGTFAGDSLVGRKARVGSGAILANRKFNQSAIRVDWGTGTIDSQRDFMGAFLGDQSRVGANVITSPGTVVGPHTWVGSGAVLNGYYGPDQLITVKQELESKPKSRSDLKAGAITYEG